MNYGARIKGIIGDNDLKQKNIAPGMKITPQMLSNYVTGRSHVPVEVVVHLAQTLNITSDYVLGLTENPEPPFVVSDAEQKILSNLRTLRRDQKEIIVQTILLMKQQNERE